MYIETNGAKYPNVRRYASGEAISYTGASLVGLENLGTVDVYRDDGFLLMTDDATQYPFKTITNGYILLRKTEPQEPQISDDEALSIITGELTSGEALDIITGGEDE